MSDPEAVLREHYELDDSQMDALLEDGRVCALATFYAGVGWEEAGDALAKQVQTVLAEEAVDA